MGTIIKLFIAAVVINAAAQVGLAEYKYYQFQDAVHEMMLFASGAQDKDLIKQTMQVADEYDVPLEADNIAIDRVRTEIVIRMQYHEDVTLVPGLYTKNWEFNPTSSVMTFGPGRLQK